MTINASDLKFFAATYPDDTSTGGGLMSPYVVQTGTENNVFPDIDAAARSSGRLQLRKVFPSVIAANAESLMGAQLSGVAASSDANVDFFAFRAGSAAELRPAAENFLRAPPFTWQTSLPIFPVSGRQDQFTTNTAPSPAFVVGDLIGVGSAVQPIMTTVTAVSGLTVTIATNLVTSGGLYFSRLADTRSALTFAAAAKITTAVSAGATAIKLDRTLARVVPKITPFPGTVNGLVDPSLLAISDGKLPIFFPGCAAIVRNGSTTEVVTVDSVDYGGRIVLRAGLVNSYPVGAVVSALLPLGDMVATVGASFTQQTWTRVWSDTITGNPIGLAYDTVAGAITATNSGAETERWAIVFSSSTAFNLIGETRGQIASGTITADFSPINPITNAPLFTIKAAGWHTGWALGNVLRFPTFGARAPIWLARCVSPSAAGSVNTPSIELRGTVNA